MNTFKIKAKISFFNDFTVIGNQKRKYRNGLITDFSVRNDMFNSGQITFLDKVEVYPGESNVIVHIQFVYGNLVAPFLKVGKKFTFGEMGHPYGEGIVLDIVD